MEARRQRIWIPACAGMTKGDVASWVVKRVARHFVIPAQAGIQGSASAEAIGYADRWIPAYAGMTGSSVGVAAA